MAKKKKEIEEIVEVECDCCSSIDPITQEFGNGDLNVLRDKINEIIARG